MSILIKEMKMPENCYDCRVEQDAKCVVWFGLSGSKIERHPLCPLVEMHNPEDRTQGKWIMEDDGTLFYRCSVCDYPADGLFSEIYMGDINYCPNCGASMTTEPDEA